MKIVDLIVTLVAIPLATPLMHAWGAHPGFGRVIIQEVTDYVFDIAKAGQVLGWEPRWGDVDGMVDTYQAGGIQ